MELSPSEKFERIMNKLKNKTLSENQRKNLRAKLRDIDYMPVYNLPNFKEIIRNE